MSDDLARPRVCPPCTGDCNQGRDCPAALPDDGFPLSGRDLLWVAIGIAVGLLAWGVGAWVLSGVLEGPK